MPYGLCILHSYFGRNTVTVIMIISYWPQVIAKQYTNLPGGVNVDVSTPITDFKIKISNNYISVNDTWNARLRTIST